MAKFHGRCMDRDVDTYSDIDSTNNADVNKDVDTKETGIRTPKKKYMDIYIGFSSIRLNGGPQVILDFADNWENGPSGAHHLSAASNVE
ncbi:hypothetical protein DFQ26_008613 [Actinomortierella ambigua]|nr:hypothetical protein DFQ26_008613 [Actinomortierella ambigua]